MLFKALTTPDEWAWFTSRTNTIACADSQGIIVEREGVIQAAAVFDSFTRTACNVHFAIDNPMVIRHGFIHEITRHAFFALNRVRIFGLVCSTNSKSLRLVRHIGMTEVARVPNAIDEGIDYIVHELTMAHECKFLPIKKEAA